MRGYYLELKLQQSFSNLQPMPASYLYAGPLNLKLMRYRRYAAQKSVATCAKRNKKGANGIPKGSQRGTSGVPPGCSRDTCVVLKKVYILVR